MNRVFMSAAFPEPSRISESGPYDESTIGMAVTAVSEVVLSLGYRLVFGGHPSISPIVRAARYRVHKGYVEVYQSDIFKGQESPELQRLANHPWVRVVHTPIAGDKQGSLRRMRETMLDAPLAAAFFVGGMSGVGEEYRAITRRSQEHGPIFLMHRPGGMTARLVEHWHGHSQAGFEQGILLLRDSTYALCGGGFHNLVAAAIAQHVPPADHTT